MFAIVHLVAVFIHILVRMQTLACPQLAMSAYLLPDVPRKLTN